MKRLRGWASIAAVALCAALAVGSVSPALGGGTVLASEPSAQQIAGKVNKPGAYAGDAVVTAAAFQQIQEGTSMVWTVVASSEVASDGTYAIDVDPGTYRVGFFDSANVYKDAFYANASKVESATSVDVATDTVAADIDQTLTANPELIVQGTVQTAGAPAGENGIAVQLWQEITAEGVTEWQPTGTTVQTAADGTYRMHLLNSGPFRLRFVDFDDVFESVFHNGAAGVEEATDLAIETTGTPLAGIDRTVPVKPSVRIAGRNRYATAVELSRSTFEDGKGGTVVIATGEKWPDALAGSTYAFANDAPLLLVKKNSIPDVVIAEIERLAPEQVVILGGTGAVSIDVASTLRAMGIPVVRRLDGRDRYETAAEIAREMINSGAIEPGENGYKVMIANGRNYADAMAGAPVAAAAGIPVLLTESTFVPEATGWAMEELGVGETIVLGGEGVVSEDVAAEFPAAIRLAGEDRYGTAAAIAQYGYEHAGLNKRTIALACGTRFSDGLVAGPILARSRQAMLLTQPDELSMSTESFLAERKGVIARIVTVGGEGVVSADVFSAGQGAIR